MLERGSLEWRSSGGVREATRWEPAGERRDAESGLEGPAGKPPRDLGGGRRKPRGDPTELQGGWWGRQGWRLRALPPPNSDFVAVL